MAAQTDPVISILITTYNIADYVAETIESVLSQQCSYPYEILIGDDGSTDGTDRIAEKYCEDNPERIRLFRMPRDPDADYNRVERSSANRLCLLKNARGKYVSFLDGDDYYLRTDRLQRMAEILEDGKNRDCILCAHNLLMVYPDGHSAPLSGMKKERKITFPEYWKLTFLQSNAVLFRNIYREELPQGLLARIYDDNNITCALLRHGKMYYLPECYGAYRQVEGSSWNAIDRVKQAASNFIGYSVERECIPEYGRISDIRHYPDLKVLYRHRAELSAERLSPFYQTAKALKLEKSLRVYRMGRRGGAPLSEIRKRLILAGAGYYMARVMRLCRKAFGIY